MAAAKSASRTVSERHKVLIVDDDVLAMGILATGLRRFGYDVVEAVDAKSTLLAINVEVPDIAILDIHMPGMNGIELAAEIQKVSKVPILYLSAYADADRVRQAIDTEPVGYLVKPVDAVQLVPQIETSLALARSIEQRDAKASNLEHALKGRRTVSTAIGIIMAQSQCDRDGAFELLRKNARSSNRSMEDLAESLLSAAEMLGSFRQAPGK